MSNLRFDTDMGRDTSNRMVTCANNLETELQTALNAVDALVPGAWEAPSANQFQQQMQEWSGPVRQAITNLQELQQRLNAEIDQWEATAASFS